ncbi:hypothetical protein [Megalodesulfovibrio paquesii]
MAPRNTLETRVGRTAGGALRALAVLAMMAALLLAALPGRPAWAETCQYTTEWGVLTLQFNYDNDTFTGNYPHKNGRVAGVLFGTDQGKGQWAQSDGGGSFLFRFHERGFTGKWNYTSDQNWRGDWNGKLIKCWRE